MKKHNRISVIIPAYNSSNTLGNCLDAVFASKYNNYEVIVISDGSTDSTVSIAKKYVCKVLDFKENKGASFARNKGARYAEGDILLFIDSDVKLKDDALEIINEEFNNPTTTVVQGLYSHKPDYHNSVTQYQQSFYCYYSFGNKDEIRTLVTCCFAVRKNVFFDCGGFNEKIKYGSEDEEFGYVLQKQGHKIKVLRNLTVEHMIGYSLFKFLKRNFVMYTSTIKSFLRNKTYTKKIGQKNYTGVFIGLFIMGLIGLDFIALLIYPHIFTILLFLILNIAFIFSKLKFLNFIKKEKGLKKTIGCLIYIYIDAIWAIISVSIGAILFALGREY